MINRRRLSFSRRNQMVSGPFHLFLIRCIFLVLILLPYKPARADSGQERHRIPILLYHRLGPMVADNMTVTTAVFRDQLRFLKDQGYTIIPLKQLVAYFLGKEPPPPSRAVVITADDGHRSAFTDMFPLVRQYNCPVTLFIYPSAISNATYALTWDQLREMRASGLFDIESHTYWHPNFQKEKKRLTPSQYEIFVEMQLTRAKETLDNKLGIRVDMLAWPFGLYDEEVIRQAGKAGYIAAFTMERRSASTDDNPMALPRYLVTNADIGKRFERLVSGK
jgi:peptidoglycan/xylan/chitin deacetylase (PgdA/CDA1 family)